jgi:hypothetical protein
MCKDDQIKVRISMFLLMLFSCARIPLVCEPDWVHVLGKSMRPTYSCSDHGPETPTPTRHHNTQLSNARARSNILRKRFDIVYPAR